MKYLPIFFIVLLGCKKQEDKPVINYTVKVHATASEHITETSINRLYSIYSNGPQSYDTTYTLKSGQLLHAQIKGYTNVAVRVEYNGTVKETTATGTKSEYGQAIIDVTLP